MSKLKRVAKALASLATVVAVFGPLVIMAWTAALRFSGLMQ